MDGDDIMAKVFTLIIGSRQSWPTAPFFFTLQTILFKENFVLKWYQMRFFTKIPTDKVLEGQMQTVSKGIGQLGGNATPCQLLVQLMTFCT